MSFAHVLAAALALLALYAVVLVHAAGQTLLALTLLVIVALALWTYTSARTHALRYLFPGVATALVFVIFPMLYTVGIGFTNYSSRNLLDEARARAYLLDEAVPAPGSARAFTLHAQGGRWRLRLAPAEAGAPAWTTPPIDLIGDAAQAVPLAPATGEDATPALPLRETVAQLPALRRLQLRAPDGTSLSLLSLREFARMQPLYRAGADGSLTDGITGVTYRPDPAEGFFTSPEGDRLLPGYRVHVGLRHYAAVFSEGQFRQPFLGVFMWTVAFAALSVLLAGGLGLFLSVLLNWEVLEGKAVYRLVLFLLCAPTEF